MDGNLQLDCLLADNKQLQKLIGKGEQKNRNNLAKLNNDLFIGRNLATNKMS